MVSAVVLACSLSVPALQQDPYAELRKNLVPIGRKVPHFVTTDDSGHSFDLYKTLKDSGAKATILSFWFST